MAEDFKISLPENLSIDKLNIVADFDKYSPLVQRTVVLCLIHPDPGLTVNGLTFLDIVSATTSGVLVDLGQNLSPIADKLVDLLNEEGEVVSDVVFSLLSTTNDHRNFKIIIEINKINGDTEYGGFSVNE